MSTSSTPSPETLSGPETVAIARTPSGRDRDSGPAGLPVARSPPAAGTSAALCLRHQSSDRFPTDFGDHRHSQQGTGQPTAL